MAIFVGFARRVAGERQTAVIHKKVGGPHHDRGSAGRRQAESRKARFPGAVWTIFHRDAAGRHANACRERQHRGTCYISKDDDHNDDNANHHDYANDDDKTYDDDTDNDDTDNEDGDVRDSAAQLDPRANEFASD